MPKVLVVEDERDAGELLVEHLRRRGFEPTHVMEGQTALRTARRIMPDLILLDLMLPDLDGFSVCETLKLDRETNLIPIVMITALHERQHVVHGWQVGANNYLTKPFSLEQLNEAIAEALTWRDEVQKGGTEGEIHFQFKSDVQYLEELNQLLSALFMHSNLSPKQISQLTTALREVGTNAIEWGNRKQVDMMVTMTYRIDKEKVTLIVRDKGEGFDPANLPHACCPTDPTKHMMVREALGLREGGFGIMMARGLVDELTFHERGTEVRLVKYLNVPQSNDK